MLTKCYNMMLYLLKILFDLLISMMVLTKAKVPYQRLDRQVWLHFIDPLVSLTAEPTTLQRDLFQRSMANVTSCKGEI
jgi:hypothetical protein